MKTQSPVVGEQVSRPVPDGSYVSDVGLEAVQIDKYMDPIGCEGIHTPRVLGRLVDMVDSDGICTELVHQSRITLALFGVDERIIFDELVRDTFT